MTADVFVPKIEISEHSVVELAKTIPQMENVITIKVDEKELCLEE